MIAGVIPKVVIKYWSFCCSQHRDFYRSDIPLVEYITVPDKCWSDGTWEFLQCNSFNDCMKVNIKKSNIFCIFIDAASIHSFDQYILNRLICESFHLLLIFLFQLWISKSFNTLRIICDGSTHKAAHLSQYCFCISYNEWWIKPSVTQKM